jgi:4-amino-4-deoxy-L-arabinose transferase-like glycosyltransferase
VQGTSILLPWYAWAVVPLGVANVLLTNLLARSLFKVVPALCVLVGVYVFALTRFHATPVMVIQTLGACNLLLLAVCAWYTWGVKQSKV